MNRDARQDLKVETSVSSYDIVNAFLVSSIIVVGILVSVLFMIWLTMILNNRPDDSSTFVVDTSFGNEKPEGFEDDIHEPGVEEFPEVETPQLADALEAITEAVSTVRANLEARDGDALEMGKGGGFGSREGGPGTGNSNVIPEYKRWKIEYDSPDIGEYARQLSFFNIDIGVISNSNNDVFRIRKPGESSTVINSNRETENKSLFFIHEKRRLRKWDESLVRKKNIELNEKFTVQFYPDSTRRILRQAEEQFLQQQGKQLINVRRTRFRVIEDGNGFAFQIASIDYR